MAKQGISLSPRRCPAGPMTSCGSCRGCEQWPIQHSGWSLRMTGALQLMVVLVPAVRASTGDNHERDAVRSRRPSKRQRHIHVCAPGDRAGHARRARRRLGARDSADLLGGGLSRSCMDSHPQSVWLGFDQSDVCWCSQVACNSSADSDGVKTCSFSAEASLHHSPGACCTPHAWGMRKHQTLICRLLRYMCAFLLRHASGGSSSKFVQPTV